MDTKSSRSKYLVLSRGACWNTFLAPAEIQKMSAEFTAWFERLCNEGKMENGSELGQTGRIIGPKSLVMDGPFPESKEAIGGYWFIYADGLEEATEIAKGNPCLVYGATVEVRPLR